MPAQLSKVPAAQLAEETKRHELAKAVQRGLDNIFATRKVPLEDQVDLQACLRALRTDKPPRFHWDCKLYTDPPQRAPAAPARESKEVPEDGSDDETKEGELKDSEGMLRPDHIKVGGNYLTIYEFGARGWSWTIAR